MLLSHPAAGRRGEDATEADNGENDEDGIHAGDEGRVVLRCNLDVADVNTECRHYHTPIECHTDFHCSKVATISFQLCLRCLSVVYYAQF
jgi:hypothetical protein